jgi:hypothetical protein
VKVVRNIQVTEEARDWLLRHYMDADADDPSQLRFIPTLACSLATYDGLGKKIRGPAYDLYKGDPRQLTRAVATAFDNGRKFFAIRFEEDFDERDRYLIEYFDRVWYVLRE